jgi:signal transduction histidine kinase/CheY-like chemotaxis protein
MATVLVVDDIAANRDLLRTLLTYAGHTVLEAGDGAEALAQAHRQPPDLVITDLLMPVMDGFEFVRRLRGEASLAATPVIFYTAHYLERDARELARQCGVRHILTKPADPEAILAAAAQALHGEPVPVAAPAPEQFSREHLQVLSDTLSRKVDELESSNRRLQALLDISERLASERDVQRLLEGVARSAREIVGARHAVIAITGNDRSVWHYYLSSGIAAERAAAWLPPPPTAGLLSRLFDDETCIQRSGGGLDAAAVGLPDGHPPFAALLAVRVCSLRRSYGWLCLTDKVAGAEFSEQDARHARMIGSLAGRVYENGSLYQEVKRTAEALSALNAELEQRVADRTVQLDLALRELETFSYSVSHDLRAPLRQIEGFSTLLCEDHAAQLAAEGLQHLGRIQAATRRMSQLIDDLLSLARVTRHEMSRQTISLSDLAEAVVNDLRAGAPDRQVTVRIAPGLTAVGDSHLLRIALDNLLGNAWKYTSKRSQAEIVFGGEERDGDTVYFVRDNGAGFDPAYAQRLFTAFQRLHSESEFEGTGVGLATVARIISRHGGRVWAEGAPEQGATFYFTLARAGQDPGDGEPTA